MKRYINGDLTWLIVLCIITAFFIFPTTQQIFVQMTLLHPYLMGFLKFGILATMGELLALRLSLKLWKSPPGILFKILAWGMIGAMIAFMFSFFSIGVEGLVTKGVIITGTGFLSKVYIAFLISLLMNLTFGPVFMAVHRISNTYIDLKANHMKTTWSGLLTSIQWDEFISFVVCKTIPFFWIPVHTIAFLLPSEYRVLFAAYLSIILGIILVYSQKRKIY